MTAQEIINLIEEHAPMPDGMMKFDRIHIGDPDKEVKKLACTFMVTVDVIKKAIENNIDMIITHEPTLPFPGGPDKGAWLETDAVYQGKKKLLEDNGIVVWQFHDGMHSQRPDMIYAGWNEQLGWWDYNVPGPNNHIYSIPETTLGELVEFLKVKLEMPSIRIIGDPAMKVKNIGVLVGGGSLGLGDPNMPAKTMGQQNLDVLICGEITEYGICEYVNDGFQLGLNKSAIIIGHERTECWGMKFLPKWLAKFMPEELPCMLIETTEPFKTL